MKAKKFSLFLVMILALSTFLAACSGGDENANSNEGEGLLFYGNTIIPFKDKFPKDTNLYRIMTTKPNEIEENDENGGNDNE